MKGGKNKMSKTTGKRVVEAREAGQFFGSWAGMALGVAGTIWGGYELGECVSYVVGLENVVARGAIDFGTMAFLAKPAIKVGYFVGYVAGGLTTETAYRCLPGRNNADKGDKEK